MKKALIILSMIMLFILPLSALADPITLADDYQGEVRIPLSEDEQFSYIYSYTYPSVPEDLEGGADINAFYLYQIDDALNFGISMDLEYIHYSGEVTENHYKTIRYETMCNNGDYLSFLVTEENGTESEHSSRIFGHTFFIRNGKAGSTVALPYLLGTLRYDQPQDDWLEERQTQKADEAVRTLIWEAICERAEKGDFDLLPDFSEEDLEDIFFPEEDFYLNASGCPVFFLYPGRIADESLGFIFFELDLEDIMDEM